MRRRGLLLLSMLGLVLAPLGCDDGASGEIKLDVVTQDQLLNRLQKQRGKVVILDLWASWCAPCRMTFPHLVEMHNKYADRGVVCMSVSVDEPEDKGKALQFLQSQNATFANYLLDDGPAGMHYFGVNGIPAVFVYDRDGKKSGPHQDYGH